MPSAHASRNVSSVILGIVMDYQPVFGIGGDQCDTGQGRYETRTRGDGAATDEIAADTVLLLGSYDGIKIDIFSDEVADLLVREMHSTVINKAGTVTVDLYILGVSALRQAQKSGYETAENGDFLHTSPKLYNKTTIKIRIILLLNPDFRDFLQGSSRKMRDSPLFCQEPAQDKQSLKDLFLWHLRLSYCKNVIFFV